MTLHHKNVTTKSIGKGRRSGSLEDDLRKLATPAAFINALIAAAMGAAVYVSLVIAPGTIGLLGAGLSLIMVAIAVIDGRSFIIPDWLSAAGIVLAIVYAAVREPEAIGQAVALATLRGLALALVFFSLRYGYAKLRGRQGLGFGDVKLAFVAGTWLDWMTIPIAIELAAFAAITTYVLRQLILRQPISATTRMPFGLFFAPAIWICWVIEIWWFQLV
ncbi:MAG TPA: A24 family peptidase [Pseudolabrys sp.]|nr:A24 family peptidase [Pseudolabrys sp.]